MSLLPQFPGSQTSFRLALTLESFQGPSSEISSPAPRTTGTGGEELPRDTGHQRHSIAAVGASLPPASGPCSTAAWGPQTTLPVCSGDEQWCMGLEGKWPSSLATQDDPRTRLRRNSQCSRPSVSTVGPWLPSPSHVTSSLLSWCFLGPPPNKPAACASFPRGLLPATCKLGQRPDPREAWPPAAATRLSIPRDVRDG